MADETTPVKSEPTATQTQDTVTGFVGSLLNLIFSAISSNGGATVIGNFLADILAPVADKVFYPLIQRALHDFFSTKAVDSNPDAGFQSEFDRLQQEYCNSSAGKAGADSQPG